MTRYPDPEDAQDLNRARESFTRFYSEHRSLSLVVLRMALHGSGIEPDDIASRMWTKIWKGWCERGPVVEAPKAFVRQCARNAAIDALRTRTDLLLDTDQLESVAARQDADCGGLEPASSPGPCHPQVLLTDPRLIAAVQELTPIERLVVLTWVESVPPPTSAQIARILGVPSASTVRGHRMRALKKLRDIFDVPGTGQEG
ncbi:DNA-directed RNA polymerase specialized sigma subunit, sigma24 family [Actinomadura meyerae]|uniref:DNA-directed RNA polymerase specialized sigma subunit, sigma24 family n=1 Tax=Actinomadura meyerae TaxID=240840 RepID=A0A239NQE5_9ACTN|nr:sigma-70 family RNA polymerase sigma factor [Actinomadura meyerae]SNT56618.1 DNA-directed RNA polymerase specialized sigma subunit, sigma24 family [Actinomadura meyerae]